MLQLVIILLMDSHSIICLQRGAYVKSDQKSKSRRSRASKLLLDDKSKLVGHAKKLVGLDTRRVEIKSIAW